MAGWIFWYVYGTVAYTLISLIFIWINWFPIKIHYELWRGRKMINIWKRGNVIVDWDLIINEDKFGIKKKDKTYKINERSGLRFKRLPIHVFDTDNIAELDFSDKSLLYPPAKFDPVVYQKAIMRALASGVNDNPFLPYIIAGLLLVGVIGICALASVYFGYENYILINDFLVKSGIIKL